MESLKSQLAEIANIGYVTIEGADTGITALNRLIGAVTQKGKPMNDFISRQAVKHLDLFTKTYCRDKSVEDDLIFRCNQCDFQLPDGTCLVKTMARKLCPDYRDFGSMGDL